MCRHPASGYVQGINDLVTPFLMVFLQVIAIFTSFFLKITMMFFNAPFFVKDFVEVDVTRVSFEFSDLESSVRENIEADSFWCMTKVIIINLSFRLIYGLHLQVLDGIQDNYTFAQPGIQTKIRCCECEHAPRKKTSCSQIPTLAHVFRFAISDITS